MPEIATFGAGCFWGVETAFQQVPGVIDTAVGYTGGETPNPTYKDVCSDETGHAEVGASDIRSRQRSVSSNCWMFFGRRMIPTQVNRQGPDFGIAIPDRDFLSFAGAGSDGEKIDGGSGSKRQV